MPKDRLGYEVAKRLFDVTLTFVALVLLSPLFLIVGLCIWLTDGGSPFYAQLRVGKDGKTFKFYKFRSMVKNADELQAKLRLLNQHSDDRTFKMKNDPRITWIGRYIRRASIDELPQLFNILQGHMSIVGPRPPLPSEVARYTSADYRRLSVTPGLTCIWQISGRSEIPFNRQVEMDCEYIAKRTLLFDIVLIVRTLPALISGRGAY